MAIRRTEGGGVGVGVNVGSGVRLGVSVGGTGDGVNVGGIGEGVSVCTDAIRVTWVKALVAPGVGRPSVGKYAHAESAHRAIKNVKQKWRIMANFLLKKSFVALCSYSCSFGDQLCALAM